MFRKNKINNEEPLEENSLETNDEKNNVKERISILDQFTDKIKNFLDDLYFDNLLHASVHKVVKIFFPLSKYIY